MVVYGHALLCSAAHCLLKASTESKSQEWWYSEVHVPDLELDNCPPPCHLLCLCFCIIRVLEAPQMEVVRCVSTPKVGCNQTLLMGYCKRIIRLSSRSNLSTAYAL
jgi:hypothetical protein